MLFSDHLIVIRGGGDLGTGAAFRLHQAGFPLVVLELAAPLAIRTAVAVSSAVTAGRVNIEGLEAERVESAEAAGRLARTGRVAVLVSPEVPAEIDPRPAIVDARLAKRNLDTRIDQAPLVVGLGPGFTAGVDCHAVVETKRGHHLGRVLWKGSAAADTGRPGVVGGASAERVIRAHRDGPVEWSVAIGDIVSPSQTIGQIIDEPVSTAIGGLVRGLIPSGYPVTVGMKVADIDPRADPAACLEISDKALAVGGGVVEAVLTHLNQGA